MKTYRKIAKEVIEFMGFDYTENKKVIDELAEQLRSNYAIREAPDEWWEDPAYDEAMEFMEKKLGREAMSQFAREVQTDDFGEWLDLAHNWIAEKAVSYIAVIDKLRELPRKMGDASHA